MSASQDNKHPRRKGATLNIITSGPLPSSSRRSGARLVVEGGTQHRDAARQDRSPSGDQIPRTQSHGGGIAMQRAISVPSDGLPVPADLMPEITRQDLDALEDPWPVPALDGAELAYWAALAMTRTVFRIDEHLFVMQGWNHETEMLQIGAYCHVVHLPRGPNEYGIASDGPLALPVLSVLGLL
ncbi:hypothetical protein B0H21DRAFT_896058 [Amylocystis lapponica]|nr:hypothetical protein B0H21DRAFT_896058 [Amylocystis lapponica]